jgi:hypothetical protein
MFASHDQAANLDTRLVGVILQLNHPKLDLSLFLNVSRVVDFLCIVYTVLFPI